MAPLIELARLGHTRGVLRWLDDWVQRQPERAALAQALGQMAREFRFDAIEAHLRGQHG